MLNINNNYMKILNDLQTVYDNKLHFKSIQCYGVPDTLVGKSKYVYMTGKDINVTLSLLDMCFFVTYSSGAREEIPILQQVKTYTFSNELEVSIIDGDFSDFDSFLFESERVVGNKLIRHTNADYVIGQKKYKRPTDDSQNWVETDEYREKPDGVPSVNDCKCTNQYQWRENGTICNNGNLCRKYTYQIKHNCDTNWVDYVPSVNKIGEVLAYSSDECGTMEYKEEWSEVMCGSEINNLYPNSSTKDKYSKYKVLLPYIKAKNETEWQSVDCGKYLNYELIKSDSFECGWSKTEGNWVYEDNLCGSEVKTKYPSLADSVVDTRKYKIKYYKKRTTLPYPQNTDDMTPEQWKWGEYVISNESINHTYPNDCDCGYESYEWRNTGRYKCGSQIGNPNSITITRVEGEWVRNGDKFTSNKIGNIQETVERIYLTSTKDNLTLNFDQSSENGYDYLIISKVDTVVVNDVDSTNNFGHAQYQTIGKFEIPIPNDGKEHFIELMYRKDSSNSRGRDNVIVNFGNPYNNIYQYEIWEEYETCSNVLTGKIEYRNGKGSCNCGYKPITGYSINTAVGYEYVCGSADNNQEIGYMYYKEYKYISCEDGSGKEFDFTNVRYEKTNHSSRSECQFDPDTNANTTKVIYRTYQDMNDDTYKDVECPNKIELSRTKKSYDCGWREEWTNDGEICCGELESKTPEPPTFNITRVEGNWTRENNKFTSNQITHNQTTTEKIYFTANKAINIYYDQDSERNYDYGRIYEIDSTSNVHTSLKGEYTGNIKINVPQDGKEHFIIVKYEKDYSNNSGRDNVIMTFTASDIASDCTQFGRYHRQRYHYSTNGGETWIEPSPTKYRYGSLIESNSSECGWLPRIDQWVTICPDITYETAVQGDECTVCQDYNMYVQQKRQYSSDGGQHWEDSNPIEYRKEKLLKFQADKCGFTGDTTEIRYTNKICENGDLYADAATWILRVGSPTWELIPGSEQYHILIEKNSDECKTPPTPTP